MAGGIKGSFNPKSKQQGQKFSSEVFKEDSHVDSAPQKPNIFSLRGILGLNQTVEINKPAQKNTEFLYGISHLQQEANVLFDHRQRDLQAAIEDLRLEIKKLIQATDNLSADVVRIADTPIIEANLYQVNVLTRIKNFIADMRKNISEAGLWVEAFASKKKKRNAFWNKAKDKKKGGDQYLSSNEHSAARSVN